MKLIDIVNRNPTPEPWAEGEKIPWDEPGFSARMLKEHLSQAHDAASRRFITIDRHVAWIHAHILGGRPTHVLDMGCGPGLYTSRLARMGHSCVGIDFGPASIAYAREEAERESLACTYQLADLREADFGEGYGLAMLIHGEMHVFRPKDIRKILRKAHAALAPDGVLLLEPHTFAEVEREGTRASSWYAPASGLFSDAPHVALTESVWDADRAVATFRNIVIDAASGEVSWYAHCMQAYTDDGYRTLLDECGFGDVTFYPSLTGEPVEGDYGLFALVARRA